MEQVIGNIVESIVDGVVDITQDLIGTVNNGINNIVDSTPYNTYNETKNGNLLSVKKLFQPEMEDNNIKIINGDTTNLLNLENIKYQWAHNIVDELFSNNWLPHKTPMGNDKSNFKQLTEDEQNAYKDILSFLVFLDSIQTNNLPNISEYITAPDIVYAMGRQTSDECVTPDTEVLTPTGWIRIDEINEDTLVLECNEQRESTFSKPIKLHKLISNELHYFKGKNFSQMVTGNHRMLCSDRYNKPQVKLAKDMYNGQQGVGFYTNTNKEGNCNKLTPYDKFLIALQADGTICKEKMDEKTGNTLYKGRTGIYGYTSTTFSFSKQRKIDKLINILDECKLSYTISDWYKTDNEKVKDKKVIRVSVPTDNIITKEFNEWVDLTDKSSSWCTEFIENAICWDGWNYGGGTTGYDSTNKNNVDIIEQIAICGGYKTYRHTAIDNRSETYSDVYRISFAKQQGIGRGSVIKEVIPYNGEVYCLTVPRGFFVIRHDGKISVTGNCIHSKSYGWILSSIFTHSEASKIVYRWRENETLLERNKFITEQYQKFKDNPTDVNFISAVVCNYLLEGLYFYNGFQFFHNLASRNLMIATDTQIRYIQRDETQHCEIFKHIILELQREEPELMKQCEEHIYNLFRQAVEWEIRFSNEIIGNKIMGITEKSIHDYTHHLANKRLQDIKMNGIFEKVKDPYTHLDLIAGVDNEASNRVNNFESTSISYKNISALAGMDDI